MNHADYLQPILILLFSAIVGITLVQKLRLSPILGYFLAGLVIGPFGLGLIKSSDIIHALAEIGLAFLLFDVGINLSFKMLWEARKDFFGLGPFQIVSTSFIIGLIAYWFVKDLTAAFVIGCGLSLSSTAIAMPVLQDAREQNTPLGRSVVAILIAQDIFVVFLLILLPNLTTGTHNLLVLMGWALLKGIVALLAVSGIGRFLLHPMFSWITATKNSEVFTGSALLFVLAIAWGVSQLGLSLPLGAFLAGLALSESDFCYLVKTEIAPFRGLLLGLFFITIGMSLNWPLAFTAAPIVLGVVAGLVLIKCVLLWVAARLVGYCKGFGLRLGLILSQGDELAFVLFSFAVAQGLVASQTAQLLLLSIGFTMALTPILAKTGGLLSCEIEKNASDSTSNLENTDDGHIIITGFDEIAQEIAKVLEAEGVKYKAFDGNRERIAEARSKGFAVDYSDIHRPKTASLASLGRAKAVVNLLDDPESSLYLADALKQLNPELPVYAATHDMNHYEELSKRNLTDVLVKDKATARIIAGALLRQLEFDENRIQERLGRMIREETSLSAAAAL